MALDPNIILGYKPPEVSSYDERMQNAQNNQMNGLKIQAAQQAYQQAQKAQQDKFAQDNIIRSAGGDPAKAIQGLNAGGHYDRAMELQKYVDERTKNTDNHNKSLIDQNEGKMKMLGGAFQSVLKSDDSTIHQTAWDAIDGLTTNFPDTFTPEWASKAKQQMVNMPPQQLRAYVNQQASQLSKVANQEYVYQSTPDGIVKLGKHDGAQPEIVINPATGKPFMASSSSPELQGNIATAKQNAGNISDLTYKPQIKQAEAGVELATKPQIAAATKGAEIGAESKANAQVALPQAKYDADTTTKLVDDLLASKGFKDAVGFSSYNPINKVRGTSANDFNIRLDQLKGKQFMQAYQNLKGGGQITEVEGKKATDAISRMNTASSEDEFVKAAGEFKEAIKAGYEKLNKQANGGQSTATPTQQLKDIRTLADGRKVGRNAQGKLEVVQ